MRLNSKTVKTLIKSLVLLITAGVIVFSGCNRLTQIVRLKGASTINPNQITEGGGDTEVSDSSVGVWLTRGDGGVKLARQSDLTLTQSSPNKPLSIQIRSQQVYQEIEGFGAHFTDSSAFLMDKLKKSNREKYDIVMNSLFSSNGIALNFLRHPMGATDFSSKLHSYDSAEAQLGQAAAGDDPNLTRFSVAHDNQYIIPTLKDALAINPKIKIMASPWSAPGWMKTSRSMVGGGLSSSNYRAYANYFIKFLDAFEAAGIPIYALSIQNEPNHMCDNGGSGPLYPGMCFSIADQKKFIGDELGPLLAERARTKSKTKLFVVDFNWDWEDEIKNDLYKDPKVLQYSDGAAFHCYWDDVSRMSSLHYTFPDKPIHLTECSSNGWGERTFSDLLKKDIEHNIIPMLRNFSSSYIKFNIALQRGEPARPWKGGEPPSWGPYYPTDFHQEQGNSCGSCWPFVEVSDRTGQWDAVFEGDYYAMGHASKFMVPGGHRIDSNEAGELKNVAVKNPDGTIVLVVYNNSDSQQSFQVQDDKNFFNYQIPGKSAVTFKWRSNP